MKSPRCVAKTFGSDGEIDSKMELGSSSLVGQLSWTAPRPLKNFVIWFELHVNKIKNLCIPCNWHLTLQRLRPALFRSTEGNWSLISCSMKISFKHTLTRGHKFHYQRPLPFQNSLEWEYTNQYSWRFNIIWCWLPFALWNKPVYFLVYIFGKCVILF